MEICVHNVNGALNSAIKETLGFCTEVAPRGQKTYEYPYPVLTIYTRPQERVLFCPTRDPNPFFHFFEPLWMLAGRNDVAFLERFVKRMVEYSDDGTVFHGAYGHRWRHWFGFDQIEEVIKQLKADPDTRRAVITMWAPNGDCISADGGAGGQSAKDLPCNTQIYLKVRNGALRMTVCNRSNDILWGLYGANATQFSVLQEYIAGKVGVTVGPLATLSDSWHVYTTGPGGELYTKLVQEYERKGFVSVDRYHRDHGAVKFTPMGCGDRNWDGDLRAFFLAIDCEREDPGALRYRTPWWRYVAAPMWRAFTTRDFNEAEAIVAEDWRLEAVRWLEKRVKRPEVVT